MNQGGPSPVLEEISFLHVLFVLLLINCHHPSHLQNRLDAL